MSMDKNLHETANSSATWVPPKKGIKKSWNSVIYFRHYRKL